MANIRPFAMVAGTKETISATTTPVLTQLTTGTGEMQVRIRNLSTSASSVCLRFGGSTVVCVPATDDAFGPGTVEILTAFPGGDGLYVSAACASGTATVEISVGSGF